MARPYQKANIPGPEMGTSVSDPVVMVNLLKSPMRKVLIIGAESLNWELDGKKLADYLIDIANKIDCHVVSTGHAYSYIKDKISNGNLFDMSLINITNRLCDKSWDGLDGEGQYSMAIFSGHLVFYVSQALSRIKNFTNWIKTIELDKFSHPNARFSLPNLSDNDWKDFLGNLIEKL
ncbi:MAG: CO dehydrogenase/acetyl-CoA synthase complex subunit epsilon [Candidatus Thorarchaeota archaeon]